jgi:hypothetical protein
LALVVTAWAVVLVGTIRRQGTATERTRRDRFNWDSSWLKRGPVCDTKCLV